MAIGDLDGDGDLDAFVGNDGPNEVWFNDGTGSFVYGGQPLGDAKTQAVILGDVDRDGDLDAFTGDQAGAEIWLNDGRGRFTDSGQAMAYSDRHVVILGDVDGDRDLDVFVGALGRGYTIWRNSGTGHFDQESRWGRASYWPAGGVPVTIAAGLFVWWAIQGRRE